MKKCINFESGAITIQAALVAVNPFNGNFGCNKSFMKTRIFGILVLCTVISQIALSQEARLVSPDNSGVVSIHAVMSGYDSRSYPMNENTALSPITTSVAGENPVGKKSPFIAGALSMVIPGAGEIYTEQYIMAAAFLVIEGLLWYGNKNYTNKGDVATGQFQNFADSYWSPVKYAEWLNANAKNFKGGENTKQIPINPDANLSPWERVDWKAMNEVELAIPQFSHRLPTHGEQQYYELIGKYNQYSYGWNDKTAQGGDGWSDYYGISQNFKAYSLQRGRANDFYAVADRVGNFIILNHVLSIIDAAWAASRWNSAVQLHSHVSLMSLPNGSSDMVSTACFTMRF
jgi:hypothetical protein